MPLASTAMRRSLVALGLVLSVTLLAPVATGADEPEVALTFPTETGVSFVDSFDDPRGGGRVHKATDVMGEKMMEIYAAVSGEVTWSPGSDGSAMPRYGYMLSIEGDDGRTYHYIHLNNDTPGTDDGAGGPEQAYAPGVEDGARVERGQLIAWMGDSGNAEGTSPHLHFSIEDPEVDDGYGTHFVNPFASLSAALEEGDATGDDAAASETATATADDDDGERGAPRGGDLPADRLAGEDRVGTAVAIAQGGWETAEDVVLANAFAPADAIVAGPLAAALDGPVLNIPADTLDDRVATELDRLEVERVTIVGGPSAVADGVVDELEDLGIGVERLFGEDEADTAAAVAERVWDLRDAGDGERRALLALGRHREPTKAWPDALAAGWHGAASGLPVLLTRGDELPPATNEALDGVTEVTLVGGSAAISPDVEDAVAHEVGEVRRLAGADRFETALQVAGDVPGASAERLWVATGWSYADALAVGPAVAGSGDTLLLVDGSGRGGDATLDAWLAERGGEVTGLAVLGGPAAVSQRAVTGLQERLTQD